MLRVSVYVPQAVQLRSELLTRHQSNGSSYTLVEMSYTSYSHPGTRTCIFLYH